MQNLKKPWPLCIPAAGLLLLMVGFFSDPGIPYQDPTPELAAQYAHQARLAHLWYQSGGIILLAGLAVCIGWMAARRIRRNK